MINFVIYYTLIEAFICFFFGKKLKKDRAYVWPLLFAAGQAAYGMYQADRQEGKARNLKVSQYVPGALQEALASSKQESMATSPIYTRAQDRLRQSTSNSIDMARRIGGTSSQLQQAAANADLREKETLKDLAVSDESYRVDRRADMRGLLMQKANYEKANRDNYNAAVSSLKGAALQNKYNAVSTLGEGVASSIGNDDPEAKAARLEDRQSQGKKLTANQQSYLRRFKIQQGYSNYGSGSRGLQRFNNASITNAPEYPEYDYVGAEGPFNY